MKLVLYRRRLAPTSLLGALYVDGVPDRLCYTLEPRPDRPAHPAIPAGTYDLTLEPTHNLRLWTPYADRNLPHVWGVPGRAGIEAHSGNTSGDTDGCVVVGYVELPDGVGASRLALTDLVDRLWRWGPGHHRVQVFDAYDKS